MIGRGARDWPTFLNSKPARVTPTAYVRFWAQSEALSFVEYLSRRRAATSEADEWQRLMRTSQDLSSGRRITDEEIAAETVAYRTA